MRRAKTSSLLRLFKTGDRHEAPLEEPPVERAEPPVAAAPDSQPEDPIALVRDLAGQGLHGSHLLHCIAEALEISLEGARHLISEALGHAYVTEAALPAEAVPATSRPTPRAPRRRVPRGQAGFTLVEVLVASLILSVGIAALLTVLVNSRRSVDYTERRAAATHIAEDAIEDLQALPYAQIALSSAPGASADPYSPDYYVSGSNYRPDQRPGGSMATEPLVLGGGIAPSSPWNDGRLSGTIHRYVTSANVGPANDVKRVTIAVTVGGAQKRVKPVLVSTVVSP